MSLLNHSSHLREVISILFQMVCKKKGNIIYLQKYIIYNLFKRVPLIHYEKIF
jgi:hypothetical protein